ncbi:proline racemase family protein [Dactylosporangium sp. NPDC048998]|uniref:proline racemase family protein n=1 Tax=Dactylosporangium sp. NPDC048998 TaxID=3363976 RepID=UPI00371AC81E
MEIERVRTVDYHTGGEPFRIVPEPPVEIRGRSVAERRVFAMHDPAVDGLRRLLCFEPRGHADMYGGFLVPPDDDGARLGVLFWHKDGFSTACGHGTIALGAWAVRSGLVAAPPDGHADVVIDVPSGRVTARVHVSGGRVSAVDFVSVPSYLIAPSVEVPTRRGVVRAAVSYGGAIYAQVDAATVGLAVTPEQHQELIALGREVKWALDAHPVARHPTDDRLSGVYGTILYESLGTTDDGALHQRNVTIFADGELDRSPCGSGTAARVATLTASGELAPGRTLLHDSIVGSRFTARATPSEEGPDGAVVPVITGMAYPTGEHVFVVDPHDPLNPGFVLR